MPEKVTGIAVAEPQLEITNNITALEQWARGVTITKPAEYQFAADTLKSAKLWRSRVVEFFRDSKEKAHATWKAIVSQEKSLTDRIDAVERVIKSQMGVYAAAEEAKRQAEQRRLQAIEDERARKEQERLNARAAKAAEKGQSEKAEALLQEAESRVAVAVQVQSAVPEVKGVSTRRQWKGRVVDMPAMIRAAVKDPNTAKLLLPDESAINKIAAATRGQFQIPGVEFYEESIMAVGQGRATI